MEKTTPFVRIVEIYGEAGVSFTHILTEEVWKNWFKTLNKILEPQGLISSKYQNFSLDFVITSSTFISDLVIKGPRKNTKNKFLEYAIWIPYARVVNDPKPLTKLTEYFKQGVADVLRKLEYPEDSIQKVMKQITDKPVKGKKRES
jgi:hypothetical protein